MYEGRAKVVESDLLTWEAIETLWNPLVGFYGAAAVMSEFPNLGMAAFCEASRQLEAAEPADEDSPESIWMQKVFFEVPPALQNYGFQFSHGRHMTLLL